MNAAVYVTALYAFLLAGRNGPGTAGGDRGSLWNAVASPAGVHHWGKPVG